MNPTCANFDAQYVASNGKPRLPASEAIVIGFKTSSSLAAAYGIAVTLTMIITALLLHTVAIERWKWPTAVVFGLARSTPMAARPEPAPTSSTRPDPEVRNPSVGSAMGRLSIKF